MSLCQNDTIQVPCDSNALHRSTFEPQGRKEDSSSNDVPSETSQYLYTGIKASVYSVRLRQYRQGSISKIRAPRFSRILEISTFPYGDYIAFHLGSVVSTVGHHSFLFASRKLFMLIKLANR
jgi:hypothetical protein